MNYNYLTINIVLVVCSIAIFIGIQLRKHSSIKHWGYLFITIGSIGIVGMVNMLNQPNGLPIRAERLTNHELISLAEAHTLNIEGPTSRQYHLIASPRGNRWYVLTQPSRSSMYPRTVITARQIENYKNEVGTGAKKIALENQLTFIANK